MSDFAETINYLTADENPARRITAIKTAVVENLRATDERVKVDVTDHFNHSFVPDLVLSWPGTTESRRLFLRTSFRAWDLMQDLDMLAADRPILMPLAPIPESNPELDAALQTRSSSLRTLITDPSGLQAFDRETETAPVVSLLSHAILQGGRGLIDSRRAREVSGEVDAGFRGARTADYETTSIAVQATEEILDSHRAQQLTSLLHAVWVGSGAPPTQFPGASGTTTALDAEALMFILELPDLDDPEFWGRLGHGLTTERLCQLVDFPGNANLQRLLAGIVHRLQSKACRVITATSGVTASQWEVVASTLTLRTNRHRVHFAPRHLNELPDNSLPIDALSVDGLRRRAARAGVSISEVKLSNGDSTIAYGSEGRPDVTNDEALAAVESAVRGASVVSATARIGTGSKTVRCNLPAGTASGNSNAMYYLSELATTCVPLLADMTSGELDEIQSKTAAASLGEEDAADSASDM